ncbi:MAG: signal peptidase I [Roseibacillus sp. TMED18]|nr:MAG: signal peptidase I [Roseibacillus sp. TMED18]
MAVPLLIVGAIYVVANWKIFEKAGQPGWAAIIPIYNIIVMLDVQGRPKWWIIWYLIPFVNCVSGVVMFIIQCLDYAKRFGKDGGFVAGLILLNPIFLLILAFGSAQYQGVSAAAAPPADPPAAPPADPPAEEA